jgi:hypothetical protein
VTQEEFEQLPPEQQHALIKQMSQVQEMRLDYGAMKDPYGASSQGQTSSPPQQRRQEEEQMPQARPQQGGGGGMDGGQMLKIANQLRNGGSVPASGAGSALTATEAASFTPAMAPASLATGEAAIPMMGEAIAGNVGAGSTAAGAAGGTGAGSGGSAMMAAGPWAALAAGIVANEAWAKDSGRRPDDTGEHVKDMLSGKVLEYDLDALGDKMPGKTGELVEIAGEMGNPEGVIKNIGKMLKPWEWF